MKLWFICVCHELKLLLRRGNLAQLLTYFTIIVALFPLSLNHAPVGLGNTAIWLAVLMASIIALPSFYEEDLADGSLACRWVAMPRIYYITSKYLAHFLLTGLPLGMMAPVAALFLDKEWSFELPLFLWGGMAAITLISGLIAALTAGLEKGYLSAAIIALPLYIPTLIFGAHGNWIGLLGIIFLLLPISLLASYFALKLALE